MMGLVKVHAIFGNRSNPYYISNCIRESIEVPSW